MDFNERDCPGGTLLMLQFSSCANTNSIQGKKEKTLEILSGLCIVIVLHFRCNVTHGIVFWDVQGKLIFCVAIKLRSNCSHPGRGAFVGTSPYLLEAFLPSVPIPRPHAYPQLHIGPGRWLQQPIGEVHG